MCYTTNGYGIVPPDEWEEIKLIDNDTGIYVYLGKDHVRNYLNAIIYEMEDFVEDGIRVSILGETVKLTRNKNIESYYIVTEFYKEVNFLLTKEDLEKMLRMFDEPTNN